MPHFLSLTPPVEQVQVLAEVGDWFKVRWHKRAKDKSQQDTPSSPSSSSSKMSTRPTAPEPATAATSATSTPRSSTSAAGEKEKDGRGGGGGREDGSEAIEADGVEEASEDGAEKGKLRVDAKDVRRLKYMSQKMAYVHRFADVCRSTYEVSRTRWVCL